MHTHGHGEWHVNSMFWGRSQKSVHVNSDARSDPFMYSRCESPQQLLLSAAVCLDIYKGSLRSRMI